MEVFIMKKNRMNLRIFENSGGAGAGEPGGSAGEITIIRIMLGAVDSRLTVTRRQRKLLTQEQRGQSVLH